MQVAPQVSVASYPVTSSTSPSAARTRLLAILGGVVVLVLLAGFAIGLPRVVGEPTAPVAQPDRQPASQPASQPDRLPDRLPGGWTALELAAGGDEAGATRDEEYAAQQAQAVAYVNEVLGGVYERGSTSFQAYVDESLDNLVTVTVFGAPGGAFAPPNGVADPALFGLDRAPVELTREGDAVCIANYQSAAQSGQAPQGDPGMPLSVSCQRPRGAQTVQVGSQDMSVADTVVVLDQVAALA